MYKTSRRAEKGLETAVLAKHSGTPRPETNEQQESVVGVGP